MTFLGKKIETYFVLNGLWNGEEGMQATTCGFGKQQPDGWYWLTDGMDDGVGPYKSEAAAVRNAKDMIEEEITDDIEHYLGKVATTWQNAN